MQKVGEARKGGTKRNSLPSATAAAAEEDVHIACDMCNTWILLQETGLTAMDADKLDPFHCNQCQLASSVCVTLDPASSARRFFYGDSNLRDLFSSPAGLSLLAELPECVVCDCDAHAFGAVSFGCRCHIIPRRASSGS